MWTRGQNNNGVAPTNITPSNITPATITSGGNYYATAGGYAIESYNNVTPSNSSPVALTSGDINKMSGDGYAIQSYSIKTPSSTPSLVTNSAIVKMGGRGYLINDFIFRTPNDADPPYVSTNDIVKIIGNSGYLYETLQSGGGIKHYTTNVTFNDNTTYQYIATGQFIACSITRTSVATAPTVQVFVKEGSSYTAVSAATQTVNGEKTFYTTSLTSGDLYIKKNSGSNFASTAFDFQYI